MAWLRWDLVAAAFDDADGPVLEIGCGRGAMGARIARRFPYTGVEPDPASAAVARARIEPEGGRVEQRVLDESGTADNGVVCAFEVLEHLADDAGALELWRTHVRPGGRLVLSVPAWQDRFGPTDEHVGHYRRYDPEDLAARLRTAGFHVSSLRLYGFPLGYALEWARDRIVSRTTRQGEANSKEDRSLGSGRFLQPRTWMAWLPWMVTVPFRFIQGLASSRGTGIVAVAVRPE